MIRSLTSGVAVDQKPSSPYSSTIHVAVIADLLWCGRGPFTVPRRRDDARGSANSTVVRVRLADERLVRNRCIDRTCQSSINDISLRLSGGEHDLPDAAEPDAI